MTVENSRAVFAVWKAVGSMKEGRCRLESIDFCRLSTAVSRIDGGFMERKAAAIIPTSIQVTAHQRRKGRGGVSQEDILL